MKKEDQFTEQQIEKIRAGIISFRLANLSSGDTSLARIAYEIESLRPDNHADDVPDENESEGKKKKPFDAKYVLKEERLRRFLAGHKLGVDKLKVIKDFLIDEEILTEKDFQKGIGETQEFLKVHAYLANTNELAKNEIATLSTTLHANRHLQTIVEDIKLDIQIDQSGLFFRVQEYHSEDVAESYALGQPTAIEKDNRNKKSYVRRGYGFTSTLDHLFHILLRGGDPEDRITYIECFHYPMKVERRGKFLIRHGGDATDTPEVESEIEEAIRLLNLYNFLPTLNESNMHEESEG